MAAQGFILLLLAAISMARMDSFSEISWESPGRERAVPAQCTARGLFCSNCQESYFCGPALGTPMVIPCEPDEVCDIGNGAVGGAGCRSYTGTTSAGECDCDTIGNSGLLADPFDASRYFICIPGGAQFLATCETGLVFSIAEEGCVENTTTSQNVSSIDCRATGVTNGFYTNDPTCETYTLCLNSLPIPLACPDGEAFDTSASQCVDRCDLGPSTFACPGSGSGAFPDTSDCTIFHVCSNGASVFSNVQCPGGELFEPISMMCLPASTSIVCPVINPCWAAHCDACPGTCPTDLNIPTPRPGSNTTTVSSNPNVDPSPTSPSTTTRGTDVIPNCNNGPGYFEYSTDCKQFWSCQDNDAGGYELILYRCPGNLVFIPASRHCSIQADLPAAPGCITS